MHNIVLQYYAIENTAENTVENTTETSLTSKKCRLEKSLQGRCVKPGTSFHGRNTPSMKHTLTWCGAYLTKSFRPVRQQGELVGATQLRSTRTNRSSPYQYQEPDSK